MHGIKMNWNKNYSNDNEINKKLKYIFLLLLKEDEYF